MENNLRDDGEQGERPPRPTAQQAGESLSRLDRDSAVLAAGIVTPWWYHVGLGAIVAMIVAGQALPGAAAVWMVAIGIIAIPALTGAYRIRYGVSISKPAGPRSRRLLLVSVGVLLLAMAGGLALKVSGLDVWWGLVPVVVAFAATVVLGRRYDDALRQEIAGGARSRS